MQSGHVSIFIQTSLTGVEWNSNAKCFVKQKKIVLHDAAAFKVVLRVRIRV
jgi:hypothetical protein